MRFFLVFIFLILLFERAYTSPPQEHKALPFHDYYASLVKENEGNHLWFENNGDLNTCGKMAFKLLKSSISHGISSKYFKKHLLIKKTANVKEADQSLTESMLSFIHEMTGGERRTAYAKKHPVLSSAIHPQAFLKEGYFSKSRCRALDDFLPTHQAYLDLRHSYINYRKMLKNKYNKAEPEVTAIKPMKKGDKGEHVQEVKAYLTYYGYLKEKDKKEKSEDKEESNSDHVYDDALVEGIKKFQEQHSLDMDGVVGAQTLKMLKLTLKERIQKLRLNLERWRYLSYPLESRFLIVNIPSYRVEGYENHKKTFVSNAIVGGAGTKTPLFKAPLVQVIVNPSWGVPTSIAVRQKLSGLQEDPERFIHAGYTFTDTTTGEEVDPTTVEWSNYSSGYFPFQLRQRPGRNNALGVIKFDIQNKFNIYLHDTNQHNLFKKNKRALSSGCIRLESPLGLATWLFDEEPYTEVETFTKLVNAHTTKHIKIKESVPVYFVYITAWVDEDGTTHFSDDPYKEDERALKEFDNSLTTVSQKTEKKDDKDKDSDNDEEADDDDETVQA